MVGGWGRGSREEGRQRQVMGGLQCGWDLGVSQPSERAVGSQESREAWNRRGSSRREDELLRQGGDVRKGEGQMGKLGRSGGEGLRRQGMDLHCDTLRPAAEASPDIWGMSGLHLGDVWATARWSRKEADSREGKGKREMAGELSYLWACGRGRRKKQNKTKSFGYLVLQ